MAAPNIGAFLARARAIPRRIPKAHAKAQAYLAEAAFADIAESSPVRTGSYRASHTLGTGAARTESFLFEHPDRPVPNERPEPRSTPLPPPDLGSVASSLAKLAPFQRVVLANAIFYAPFIEYGTGAMSPRLVFDRARQNTRSRLAQARAIFLREVQAAP